MTPGGGAVRRRVQRGLATLVLTATIIGATGSAAIADDLRAGEDGSGPTPIPVVDEHTSLSRSRAAEDIVFVDVGTGERWALEQIRHVAATHAWMRDFRAREDGTYRFRPNAPESRKYFARTLVKAFSRGAEADPTMRFPDLDATSPWLRWAAIAVEHGWMRRTPDGRFAPDEPVTMAAAHRALVWAVGLRATARDLDAIRTSAGQRFKVPASFGALVLGMRLEFRYNAPSGSEEMDVGPKDTLTRAQVAYSLARATRLPSWAVSDMREQYHDITLPYLGARRYEMVQWGIRYAGYPYVWGGEWGFDRSVPAAFGSQPRSGFDCSGFSWWILRADEGSWNITPPRPYPGWTLRQRTSAEMARMTVRRIAFRDLEPGDLMFYDGNEDGTVDHVDTYIGNGFALDSSSTPGGVTIMWVGDGWYRDHFVHGRRIVKR